MKRMPLPYLTLGRRIKLPITPEEYEVNLERYIRVFLADGSGIKMIETANKNIVKEINQFKKMLELIKKYNIDTLQMTDKECISKNEDEVYLMCKLAEGNSTEIQFINEEISSKDVIKKYEENHITDIEINL